MSEHNAGQVAASAAEIYETFFVPALFADWPDRVLAAAEVGSGDRVADIACGTGVLARAAQDCVGANGSVTGVDINEGMLAVARELSASITWQTGDASRLPFDDATFDRVVSQFGLMFFPDQAGALREMRRIVRPGGRVAVAVWGSLDSTPGYAAMASLLNDLFGADIAASVEAPYSLGDAAVIESLCVDAGINDANIGTIIGQARFPSVDTWVYTDIKGWTLADLIDDADYARLVEAAPTALSAYVDANGGVAFDAPAHIVTFTK